MANLDKSENPQLHPFVIAMSAQGKARSLCFQVLLISLALFTFSCASPDFGKCSGARANPSVYNFALGGRPAKVISDGRLLFDNVTDTYLEERYVVERAFKLNAQPIAPVVFENNILFLNLEKHRALFDAGNSFLSADNAGFLFENLEAEGIARTSITDIFICHAHFDHIGGLLLMDGKTLAFPSAKVHINRKEWEFWTAETVDLSAMALPAESQEFLINSAKAVFENSGVAERVSLFEDGDQFLDTITAFETNWHTPGHTSYRIDINGDKLLYTGDALGIESTSINNPWFRLRFDLHRDAAVVGRVRLLEELAATGTPIIAYHGSFPGIGRIVTNDLTFDFKPVNWEFSKGVSTECAAL